MKNKALVLLAGLSALSLQAQADTFELSNLVASPSAGRSVTTSLSPSNTPETAAPVVTETPHVVTSEIARAPTRTVEGSTRTTTTFTRTTTSYAPSSAGTETYKAVVAAPGVTGVAQRVRLSGSIKSLVQQTMTFAMIANGAYTNEFDADGDRVPPTNPVMKYKFSVTSFPDMVGGINLADPHFNVTPGNSDPAQFTNYNETSEQMPLNFTAGEVKYFSAQVSTNTLASITDFLISFTGAPSMGQASDRNFDVVEITYTPISPTIPEPETYSLLLAGLGVMGFVARRSKRTQA